MVNNVRVFEKAEDAVQAKLKVIYMGAEIALIRAVGYLNPNIKTNVSYEIEKFIVEKMVRKFRIVNERITPTTYSANLTYYLDQNTIEQYLESHRFVEHNDLNSGHKLVLPIMINDPEGSPDLEWYNSWKIAELHYGFKIIDAIFDRGYFRIESLKFCFSQSSIQCVLTSNRKQDWLDLIAKHNADDFFFINASFIDEQHLNVMIERPLTQQNTSISFYNEDRLEKADFYQQVVRHIIKSVDDTSFNQVGASVQFIPDEYDQISIIAKYWPHINKLIEDYDYLVQYISNEVVVIEIRSSSIMKSVKSILRNSGFDCVNMGVKQWVISQ